MSEFDTILVRHRIQGLEAWENFRIPEVNSRVTGSFLYVWHGNILMIADLKTFEVIRHVALTGSNIEFVEVFGTFCYGIAYDRESSIISSFNVHSSGIVSLRVPGQKVISIEHIDAYSYVAGTEQGMVLWIDQGKIVSSIKALEQSSCRLICLKSYYFENELHMACGMGNGEVVLANINCVRDIVPSPKDNKGKVTGLEMLKYGSKDYFVIFREQPGSLSVVRHSDNETDYYEEYSIDLEENVSLIQMTSYRYSCFFLLTLNSTTLKVSFYNGTGNLFTIYQNDILKEDIRNVVTFAIPESSMFYYTKEFGCDLCMVSSGGSEIQVMSLTDSKEEMLGEEIENNCRERSIWQIPELQTRVIRELTGLTDFHSEYYEEDLKIIDLLVNLRKGSIICDFILRKSGNNYVLPAEFAKLVDIWVKKEVYKQQKYIDSEILPQVIQAETHDLENLYTHIQIFLGTLYEIHYIALSLEKRLISKGAESQSNHLIFKIKVISWLITNNLLDVFNDRNWSFQRDYINKVCLNSQCQYSDLAIQGILLDYLSLSFPQDLSEILKDPLNKEKLLILLETLDEEKFTQIFLYFLLDLEEDMLELKNIHGNFINDFFVSWELANYIRGIWSLDMLSNIRIADMSETNEKFQIHAKNALYELTKVTHKLSNNEKLMIMQYFNVHKAIEQTMHWIVACDLDWTDSTTIQKTIGIFFDGDKELDSNNSWIQAYTLINIINPEKANIPELMRGFIDLLMLEQKAKKNIVELCFCPELKQHFFNSLPIHDEVRFFTLINNKMYKKAFAESEYDFRFSNNAERYLALRNAFKELLKSEIDMPNSFTLVNVKTTDGRQGFSSGQRNSNSKSLEGSQSFSLMKPMTLFRS